MKRHSVCFIICVAIVILAGMITSICAVNTFVKPPVHEITDAEDVSIPVAYGTDTDTIVFSPWDIYEVEEVLPYNTYKDSLELETESISNYGEVVIDTFLSVFTNMDVTTDSLVSPVLETDKMLTRYYVSNIDGYHLGMPVKLRAAIDFSNEKPDFAFTMKREGRKVIEDSEKEKALMKVEEDLKGLMTGYDNELVQFLRNQVS